MKKMVRLLSIVMLIAMCVSLMSVGAFADGPVVIVPGSASEGSISAKTGGNTVFSYGSDNFVPGENEAAGNSIITEPDGRLKTDGRDYSLFTQDVSETVSESVMAMVAKYAADVNINNDVNPYYFEWLMNKFVNGEIDYANPDNELATARALFAEFIDSVAVDLAEAAAANQVLDDEQKEALEVVANAAEPDANALQNAPDSQDLALANEAEKALEEKTQEILDDIAALSGEAVSGKAAAASAKKIAIGSAVYSGKMISFKKVAFDLHNLITPNGSISVSGTQVLDTNYKGDIVFDFQNCTVSGTPGTPVVQVNSGLFKFKNGIINNDFLVLNGGSVILDNMKVNVPASGKSAVIVNGGYADMVRSNYFTSNSAEAVVDVHGGNVIFDGYIDSNTAKAGIYMIGDCRVTKNGGDILYNTPATDIYAPTGVIVDGGTFVFNGGSITGAAKPGTFEGAAIAANDVSNVNVTVNGGSTGSILSAYNAAIWVVNGQGSKPTKATVAVSDMSILKDATGFKSDVSDTVSVATYNNVGYPSLQDAVDAAMNDGNKYPVQVINDVSTDDTVTIDKDVVINGNGHKIFFNAGEAFKITGGNVVIENLVIDSKDVSGKDSITVTGGNVSINDVTVDNCSQNAISVTAGSVTVDGLKAEESGANTVAINAAGGKTVVYGMETNSETPVKGSAITIYQAKCREEASANVAAAKAAVGPGSSATEDGGFLYITARGVTLEIVSGGAEDGSYFMFEKGKGKDNVLQFAANDVVDSITAIGPDGSMVNLNWTPSADGKSGTLLDTNLMNLDAGEYTLSFKFKNSGAIKVPLYVSPAVKETDAEATTQLFLTKYDKDKALWFYDAQSHVDGWIKISPNDVPLHVGLGPDRDNVIWISDECIGKTPGADGLVKTELLHDDLDHLGNGINYVWLDYGTYWVPVKFNVYNAAATISPTTTDWNKIDGDKVFSVWPDVLTVKLNGQSLNSDKEYTFKDGKLTLKSSFLKTLANGNYVLEVSTSKGGVFADLSIGEVLRPKNIDYHVYGGNKPITFVASNDIDYSKGIWIGKQNPIQIDPQYITQNGPREFTLSATYLNRLSTLGTYYISAYVGDQYCTTTFRIISASQAAYNPSTGDNSNIVLWLVILALAAVALVVIIVPMVKKNKASANAVAQEAAPEEEGKKE